MRVVSHYQLQPLLDARRRGLETSTASFDLGCSHVEVTLGEDGVELAPGERLLWGEVERMVRSRSACFDLVAGCGERIQTFSATTGRVLSLFPTSSAPTLLLAGVSMHRIKGTDPWRDTWDKLRQLAPEDGDVLDTTTGLGYTAIAAARSARSVLSLEVDPGVVEMARANPWSRELFDHPRIERRLADAVEEVPRLETATFSHVLHDPPQMNLAGDLYSGQFYRELYRLLVSGGRLFHYVGNPASPSGRRVARGVMERLRHAGFVDVVEAPAAFGLAARKGGRPRRRARPSSRPRRL